MNTAGTRAGAYETLDAWRGIAALWVVVFHAASEVLSNLPSAQGAAIYGPALLGYLGVQIFFVISGYCIASAACVNMAREKGWWAFALARLRRIFPPMWISLVFFAAFKAVASIAAARGLAGGETAPTSDFLNQGFLYYFSNATLTQIVFREEWLSRVCWTLCYELAFYLATALLIIAAERLRKPRLVLNALHTITAVALAGLLVAPQAMFYPFDLWPQFGLGVLVYDLLQSREKFAPRVWAAVIGVQVVAFVALHQLPLGYQNNPSREQFVTALGLAVLLLVLRRFDGALARVAPVRWLAALGVFSYSLYLVHLLVITVLLRLTLQKVPPAMHLGYAVMLCGASIAAGLCFHQLFEKPFTRQRRKPLPQLAIAQA